ncbi:MAG: LysM peptidoglycan-binding domain-containing protein [Nioella sp.]
MASGSGTGLGFGTLATGASVAAVAVAGVVVYQLAFAPDPGEPTPPPAPTAQQEAPAAPPPGGDTGPTDTETAPTTPASPAEDPLAPVTPRFDLVRIDAAGGALIAGQSAANAELRLRLDGEEIHLASSDAGGDFVAMFEIPLAERPRVLSLEMIREDGSPLVSEQSVIISPSLRPAEEAADAVVAEMPSSGPDTPEDSGIGDLALAEGEDAAPSGSAVTLPPATPSLPERLPLETTAPSEDSPDIPAESSEAALSDDPASTAPTPRPAVTAGSEAAPESEIPTRGLSPAGGGSGSEGIAGAEVTQDATPDPAGNGAPNGDAAPPEAAGTEAETAEIPSATDPVPSEAPVPDPPTRAPDAEAPEPDASPSPDLDATGEAPGATPTPRPTELAALANAAEDTEAEATDHDDRATAPTEAEVTQDATPDPAGDGAPNGDAAPPEAAGTEAETAEIPLATDPVPSEAPVPDPLTRAPDAEAPEPDVSPSPDLDATGEAPGAASPAPSAPGDATIAEVPAPGDGEPDQPVLQATPPDPAAPADPPAGIAQAPSGSTPVDGFAPDSPADPAVPQDPESTEEIDSADPPEAPVVDARTPTVLLADGDGIRVIQSGDGPAEQRRISLDTISYDTEGDVLLAGRGSAEADVRFYLDNQPIQVARIDLSGSWRTQLPQVDPGTYTLRLDELTPAGAVQSRIETPFLREEPETVAEVTARRGENVITVQWGNTLWGIAQQQLGEGIAYVQIFEANRDQIRDPDLIFPGQIFTIPGTE